MMRLKARWASLKKHKGAVILVLAPVAILVALAFFWVWISLRAILGISEIEDQARLGTELVKTLAQIVLGILVVGTLWVAWRRATAAEQSVEVANEGQITERFTRAVEQLGNQESMAIRLGGIYALERIAKDSPKDHWQVMEVLTAYVRESQWLQERVNSTDIYRRVPTDIQAIMNVLKRRNTENERAEHKLGLSDAHLFRADLRYINLRGANLFGGNLAQTNLRHTDLSHANLTAPTFMKHTLEKCILGTRRHRPASFLRQLSRVRTSEALIWKL